MAFKAGLEQWNLAVQTFESNDLYGSLTVFEELGGTSKIHFNIGVIYSLLGNYDLAIASYTNAIELDNYLAIGYFARALANMEINDVEAAYEDFNDCLLYLRGNQFIDYFQLGLDFRLYSCEVLYNRGLCSFKLNQPAEGMNDLLAAFKEKQKPYHDIINRALDLKGKNCPMFRLPDGCLFRPCESMVKNTKKIDYLGQAKVIAANAGPPLLNPSKSIRKFPEPVKPLQNDTCTKPLTLENVNRSASALVSPRLLTRSDTLPNMHSSLKMPSRSNTLKTSSSNGDLSRSRFEKALPRKPSALSEVKTPISMEIPKTKADANIPHTPPINSSPEEDSYLSLSKAPSLTHSASSFNSPTLPEVDSSRPRAPVPKGKMKIKCHHHDTRTLMVDANIRFKDLQQKISEKFMSETALKLKYKDEDDELVLITDQEDLDMALASLCTNSDGTMSHLDPDSGFDGRFEVWCSL